jgi:hypothetical protein
MKRWGQSDSLITKDEVDRVSIFGDKTGNGNNAIQATDAKKWVWVANQIDGHPVLRSDSTDDYMQISGLSSIFAGNDIPFTIFWVAKRLSTGTKCFLSVGDCQFQDAIQAISWSDTENLQRRGDDMSWVTAIGPANDTSWHYYVLNFHGTTMSLKRDGITVLDSVAWNADTITSLDDVVLLGARANNNGDDLFSVMEWAEDGFYNNDISGANITLLETYLHTRYPSIGA